MNSKRDTFESTFDYKVIYLCKVDLEKHKGLIKVGDTTLHSNKSIAELPENCHDVNAAARNRINAFSSQLGVEPTLLHAELAVREVVCDWGFVCPLASLWVLMYWRTVGM